MKKSLSLILAIMMIMTSGGVVPLGAFANTVSNNSALNETEFSNQLSDLLSNHNDNYFGEITIDVENNTIKKDDQDEIPLEKYDIDYSHIDTTEPIVPVVPVMDIIGEEARFDKDNAKVIVNGEDYNFVDKDLIDNGEVLTNDNGMFVVENDGETTALPAAYMTEEQADSSFGLEFHYHDGLIKIHSPYQTKRLVVKSDVNLKNTYGATETINRSDGYTVLQYSTIEQTINAADNLSKKQGVKYVVPDEVVSICSYITERDGAERIQSDKYINYLNENNKNTKVTVAVIDTGAEVNHEMLKNRMASGYSVYNKNSDVTDLHGHGTHVSGIVADNTPANVKIMPIQVMNKNGQGTSLSIAEGIKWAVNNGADVINMSLGGTCTDDNCPIRVETLKAINNGVTVVVAAGNETNDTVNFCPANIEECITVSSVDQSDYSLSSFSNFGNEVDIAAPGNNILSAYPGNTYKKMSGTSMASPFVAAAAALIKTDQPNITPTQLSTLIKSKTTDMLMSGYDIYTGAGLLNMGKEFDEETLPSSIRTNPSSNLELDYFSVAAGYMLKVSAYNDNVLTNASFSVTCSNESVAKFDGRNIIPTGEGECKITVAFPNELSKEINVVVKNKEVWVDVAAKTYAGGKGTKDNPYLISNPSQLAKLAKDVRTGTYKKGSYYKLTNDINLAGKLWISINHVHYYYDYYEPSWITESPFEGYFDGNNHVIKNMTVFADKIKRNWYDDRPVNYCWYMLNGGLFGDITNASISNLGVENAYVTSGSILANEVYENSEINNCFTSGFSGGNGLIGGVFNYNVRISNCFSSATVLGNGIASIIYSSLTDKVTINNVFFCGTHMPNDEEGSNSGFAGFLYSSMPTQGQQSDYSGKNTYLYNCFSTSESPSGIGFAENNEYANVFNCYSNKNNKYTIKNTTSPQLVHSMIAVDDSFFKAKGNYTSSSNWNNSYPWDFTNTWAIDSKINNGYPYLKNMIPNESEYTETGTWIDYASKTYDGGSGTKDDPYIIKTAAQLALISKQYRYGGGENKYFSIENDIDLAEHIWYPIAAGRFIDSLENDTYSKHTFFGNINGNNHTITGLKIENGGDDSGFISVLDSGTICNINFEGAEISGASHLGIICGKVKFRSIIANCHISGSVTATNSVYGEGSVCSELSGGSKIINVHSTANITAKSAGGIVGYNYGEISQSSYNGALTATYYAAMAANNEGVISDCISYGTDLKRNGSSGIAIYNSVYVINNTKVKIYSNYYNSNLNDYKTVESPAKEKFSGFDFEKIWNYDYNKKCAILKESPYIINTDYPTENWLDNASTNFAGGNGTKNYPYLITTPEQLSLAYNRIANPQNGDINYYYKLANDIDMKGKLFGKHPKGMYSIVKLYFDGGNHTISNICFNSCDGLFPICGRGEIKNLNILNVSGTTSCTIIKDNEGCIKNCNVKEGICMPSRYVSSNISGITSYNHGTIENSSFDGIVYGNGNKTGGITAFTNGTIKNCYTQGKIVDNACGLLACSIGDGAEIINCYSTMESPEHSLNADYSIAQNFYGAGDIIGDNRITNTLEDLRKKETFNNWDFDGVWDIDGNQNNGLPYIKPLPTYKIKYNLNGGRFTEASNNEYVKGSPVGFTIPSKANNRFDGWYSDSSLTKKAANITDSDSSDKEVFAKWVKQYYIVFEPNCGSGKAYTQTVDCFKETPLMKNSFTRKNYRFVGWSLTKNGKKKYNDKQSILSLGQEGEKITLYALWAPTTYNIKIVNTLNKESKTITASKNQTVVLKNDFKTPKGKVFVGWSETKNGKVKYKNSAKVKDLTDLGSTVTLYSKWRNVKYNIKYTNGLSGKKKKTVTQKGFEYGKAKKLRKNTFKSFNSSYVLGGWECQINGKRKMFADGEKVKNLTAKEGEMLTFEAYWVSDSTYKIRYNLNGGKLPKDAKTKIRAGRGYYKLPTPTKKGYKFVGWYTNKKCKKGKTTKINPWIEDDVKLYAKWEKK